jgi:acyl dehydratase/predicted acetyltransferase
MTNLEFSEPESKRFHRRIFRGTLTEIDEKGLLRFLESNSVDIAFIRLPSQSASEIAKLNKLSIPIISADTLVYYSLPLQSGKSADQKNKDLRFIPCTNEHAEILKLLITEIFADYTNHYFSNPFLAKNDITNGYVEWAQGFIEHENRVCWLVQNEKGFIGFATCRSDEGEGEGVLYGVVPSESGKGIYADIIRFTRSQFEAQGLKRMIVSTQIQNYAVQKVWMREGFIIDKSYATIHLNCMFGHAPTEFENKVVITNELIERFGVLSGDRNPIHFDEQAAREAGFNTRIAHGLFVSSAISEFFGTAHPGAGTIITSCLHKYLKPLYLGEAYRIRYSFPLIIPEKGFYKSVVIVYNESNEICFHAYYDLIKR